MKHTAGPWTKQTDGKGFFWIDKLTDDGGFSICNCGDGGQAEANALLIAAAPDMLLALQSIPEHVLDCKHTYPHTEACFCCVVKAAITKTEGK